MRILVAEDDGSIAKLLRKGLETESYSVDTASDGTEALRLASQCDYNLLILDLGLPSIDGLEVLMRTRGDKPDLPIIVLTGRDEVADRVTALNAGADDYLTKPFSYVELSARVRALLRRAKRPARAVLSIADLQVDRVRRITTRADRRIDLTSREFALLEYLMLNSGRQLTRAMIADQVWKLSPDAFTNIVDVYIAYLRQKIDSGHEFKLIQTIRGVGYAIDSRPVIKSTDAECEGVNGEGSYSYRIDCGGSPIEVRSGRNS